MQRKPGQDLTQGPVARSLFRLTAPMMLAISSSIIVQMIEIGFIGQLGTAQIAAVTFTFPINDDADAAWRSASASARRRSSRGASAAVTGTACAGSPRTA